MSTAFVQYLKEVTEFSVKFNEYKQKTICHSESKTWKEVPD